MRGAQYAGWTADGICGLRRACPEGVAKCWNQVLNFRFTQAQREAANEELKRRGMEPIEWDEDAGRWKSLASPVSRPRIPLPIRSSPGGSGNSA